MLYTLLVELIENERLCHHHFSSYCQSCYWQCPSSLSAYRSQSWATLPPPPPLSLATTNYKKHWEYAATSALGTISKVTMANSCLISVFRCCFLFTTGLFFSSHKSIDLSYLSEPQSSNDVVPTHGFVMLRRNPRATAGKKSAKQLQLINT